MQSLKKLSLLLFLFFGQSCDKGLAPIPASQISTISGSIHFTGLPKDSVNILAVVLVQATAPFTAASLIAGFNTTVLPFSLSTTTFSDTTYKITVKSDSTYHYLGVAQNYGSNLLTDWRVVAFAHDSKDSAQSFTLKSGEQRTGVDLTIRFDTVLRQPFIK